MSTLRKLKAYVLGRSQSDIHTSIADLEEAHVPCSTDDCRTCADPCDHGHDEYPSRFNVDIDSQMFGSVKEYRRQVIISTGLNDWPSKVTSEAGTLASLLDDLLSLASKIPPTDEGEKYKETPGLLNPLRSDKVTILNGSHRTLSNDHAHETVLVFPDYKIVTGIGLTKESAGELWRSVVDPAVPRAGQVPQDRLMRSWVLPYSCVILICSHKRRDNRCGIAAPMLERAFLSELEREGWEVQTQLDDPSSHGPALDDLQGTEEERGEEMRRILKSYDPRTCAEKRALIIRSSHFGGHKYAGNCIIYTPQGVGVWYGRVTPHHAEAVVRETIIKGKVLPELLRGGLCLSQPGLSSLHDSWS